MKVCPKCGGQFGDDANFCTVDAGRLVSMTAEAAGPTSAAPAARSDLLGGRFELGDRVGGGATGAVHRAIDTQSGTAVAVKLVSPAVVAQPTLAQRVERELKLLEKVDHPAVARVLGSGRHGDQLWFAMEWLEGATPLPEFVPEGGVEAERASDLTVAIGGALVDAAKVGVVHRDLSPKNVLIVGGAVKLINFAVPVPGEKVAGAPSFLSPEAIEGKPIDQRSATYSLGAMYYYLLTGQPPFTGDAQTVHAAHLAGAAVPPSQRAAVAADVDTLVGRAMERKPTQRFLTLRSFIDDIEKVKKGPDGGTGSTAPFGRVGKKPKELAATMLGLGPMPGAELATRQMDVEMPPEALREAAALGAAAAAGARKLPAGSPTLKQMNAAPPSAATAPPAMAAPVPAVTTTPGYPAGPAQALAAAAGVAPQPAPAGAAGSPWAPPAGAAPGQVAPTAQAAPHAGLAARAAAPLAAAPPVLHAPATRSTGPASQPGGKKKPEVREKKASKGKFRETMWFKKGDLDAAAAEHAAADKEGTAVDKADLLPIEERYGDDGSITTTDAERYSLKTGQTTTMPAIRDQPQARSGSVSEDELIGEMKGGRKPILVVIVVAVIAAIVIAVVLSMV